MKQLKNIALFATLTASTLAPVITLAHTTTFDCSANTLHQYLLKQRSMNSDAQFYTSDILPIQDGTQLSNGCEYTNIHYYLHKKNLHLDKYNAATAQWLSDTLSGGYTGVGPTALATTGSCTLMPKDQFGYRYYNCTNVAITITK